jgi:hypothetical protein
VRCGDKSKIKWVSSLFLIKQHATGSGGIDPDSLVLGGGEEPLAFIGYGAGLVMKLIWMLQ